MSNDKKWIGVIGSGLLVFSSISTPKSLSAQTVDVPNLKTTNILFEDQPNPSYLENLVSDIANKDNRVQENMPLLSEAQFKQLGHLFGQKIEAAWSDTRYRQNLEHMPTPLGIEALISKELDSPPPINFLPSKNQSVPIASDTSRPPKGIPQLVEVEVISQPVEVASNHLPSPIQPQRPKKLEIQTLPPVPELLTPKTQDPPKNPEVLVEETLIVKEFQVIGNTVFSASELQTLTNPFLGRPLSFQDLQQVRSDITDFYVDQGYVTSGAFIPADQDLSQAIVTIQVVEGRLDEIQIIGNQKLKTHYIRDRIAQGAKGPLNINRLLNRLQTFQLNPLISKISAELAASDLPGFNILVVAVEEADSRDVNLSLNNNRSNNIGSFQRQISGVDRNLFGLGDKATLSYANTDGSHELDVGYSIPVTVKDGTINVGFQQSWTRVLTEPFNQLDLTGSSRSFSLGYRQPVIASPNQELTVGVQLERRESSTKLLGIPFPLSAGSDAEGRTKVSGVNLIQEWITRDQKQVLALRSDFGIGLDIAATKNQNAPDGQFLHWRGQAQWIRELAQDASVLMRSNIQLADRALPSMEQFGLGGSNSLRGYPTDFLLVDNGITASAEARFPLLKTRNREGILQVVPFLDYGYGWNWNKQEIVGSNHALAAGIGLHSAMERSREQLKSIGAFPSSVQGKERKGLTLAKSTFLSIVKLF